MALSFPKYLLPVFFTLFLFSCISAQNLVPNPSFEVYTTCPVFFAQPGDPLPCIPWHSPTDGTSDYFHSCAPPMWVGVPQNLQGYQYAHTGDAYAGAIYKSFNSEYHEYLQASLDQPLQGGVYYYVSFYVSLAESWCGIERIGAFFSVTAPAANNTLPLLLNPQVESDMGFLSDKMNWMHITGCFLASGGEQYITIGNFHSNANTPIDPACTTSNDSYYYIDDVMVIDTIFEELVFDLGGPVIACYEYEIDPGVDGESYSWSNGSHLSTLNVTESGTYSVTIYSGCTIGEDEIEVTIIGQEPVDIDLEQTTLCPGDVLVISLDPALGDYEWNDGSTSSEYEISSAGEYSVTLDDGCSLSSDMISVNVIEPPQPFSLGEDTTICYGEVVTFSLDPTFGDFEWSDGSTNSDYTIDDDGSYTLTISNPCGEAIDEIFVTLMDIPNTELGPDDVTLCFGDLLIFELEDEESTFIWQDGTNSATYTITGEGLYTVTGYNICGENSDEVFVDVLYPPVIDLGPDITLCPAQLPYSLNVGNDPNVADFVWQNGSLGPVLPVLSPGVYSVTVSNHCFSNADTLEIFVDDILPAVVLPADLLICPGEEYTLSSSGTPGNYLWQDSSTDTTFLVTTPGWYALTISNACGSGSDSILIDYQSPIDHPDLGPDISLCPGEQVVLFSTISGASYLWQDLSTSDTLVVDAAGTYYVQVADQCTSTSDTIEVSLDTNPPQLSLPAQFNLCQGDSIILDAGISGVAYFWNDLSASSTLTVTAPGSYSLTVSNACGIAVDTVSIIDAGPGPSVSLGSDIQLCPGDIVTLSPVASSVATWLWSDGSTLDSYSVTGSELVTVTVTNSCGVSVDTLLASILPAIPAIELGADTSICPGSLLFLSINTPDVSIEWSDGSTNNQFFVQTPGSYFATISNSCGVNADTIHVGVLPPAPVVNLGLDQTLCPGEIIALDPGVINATYLWQDGSTSSSFNAIQAGIIILFVSNVCGTDSDTLVITASTIGPQVNLGDDISACEGDLITLTSDIFGVDFLWQDGSTSPDFSTSLAGEFILQVSNNCGTDNDTVLVNLLAAPDVFDLGPDTILCPGESILLVAPVTGQSNLWQDGSSGPIFIADKEQAYSLILSNNCGISSDELKVSFDHRVPIIQLDAFNAWCPGEIVTLDATQLFPATYQWSTGSDAPVIEADAPGNYFVEVTAPCSDATGETEIILADSCAAENSFFLPNVFSPNGDHVNDEFTIYLNENIVVKAIQMSIFDRWGNLVFESNTLPVLWDGTFGGTPLNPGVFVYRIQLNYFDRVIDRTVMIHGDVTLVR